MLWYHYCSNPLIYSDLFKPRPFKIIGKKVKPLFWIPSKMERVKCHVVDDEWYITMYLMISLNVIRCPTKRKHLFTFYVFSREPGIKSIAVCMSVYGYFGTLTPYMMHPEALYATFICLCRFETKFVGLPCHSQYSTFKTVFFSYLDTLSLH